MGGEWIRRRKPLLVALALVALAALRPVAAAPEQPAPQQGPPDDSPVTALPDVTVSAPEPRYVAPTTRDRIGRIWAPVLIDGKGPFRLVLDTGASNSAILPRVAEELGTPIHVDSIKLRGVTGTMVASSIRVKTLEVGELLLEGTTMPIVSDVFGGADGVLGTEGLTDKRIVIEFRRDRITIVRSHREPAPPGYLILPFKFVKNRGLRIKMSIGGVPAVAVIDTGAQATGHRRPGDGWQSCPARGPGASNQGSRARRRNHHRRDPGHPDGRQGARPIALRRRSPGAKRRDPVH